jgi:hypothetical protein
VRKRWAHLCFNPLGRNLISITTSGPTGEKEIETNREREKERQRENKTEGEREGEGERARENSEDEHFKEHNPSNSVQDNRFLICNASRK